MQRTGDGHPVEARGRPASAMILLDDWPLFVVLVGGLVVVGMMVLFKLM